MKYQEPATTVELGREPQPIPTQNRTLPGFQEPATTVSLNYEPHNGPCGATDNRGSFQEPATVVELSDRAIKGGGSAYKLPMAKQPWDGQGKI